MASGSIRDLGNIKVKGPTWRTVGSNETRFFRFPWQFLRLEDHLVGTIPNARTIRILSVGASTGQEPISALITYFRALNRVKMSCPNLVSPTIEITAIDINQNNIDEFMANRHSICPTNRPELANWKDYFVKVPQSAYGDSSPHQSFDVALKPEYHKLITYIKLNLRSKKQIDQFSELNKASYQAIFFNEVARYLPYATSERLQLLFSQTLLYKDGIILST